jgi:hypothetical protein
MWSLIGILKRADAADKRAARSQGAIDRPKDADVITAALAVMDRAYGKPGPDRSPQGLVGTYDLDKLNGEQTRRRCHAN